MFCARLVLLQRAAFEQLKVANAAANKKAHAQFSEFVGQQLRSGDSVMHKMVSGKISAPPLLFCRRDGHGSVQMPGEDAEEISSRCQSIMKSHRSRITLPDTNT